LIDSIQLILYVLIVALAFYFSIKCIHPIAIGELDDTNKIIASYQYLMRLNKDRVFIKYFCPRNLDLNSKWFEFPLPFLFKPKIKNDDLYCQYFQEY